MTIQCITFDLDDTLWDCAPVLRGAEQAFYDWLARHHPRIAAARSPEALMEHRRAFFAGLPRMAHDMSALRKRWLHWLGEEAGVGAALVEPGFAVFRRHRNRVNLYDRVPEVLGRLGQRYRLGVITNGNADVHRIGIGHHFDFVITAAEAGAAKPAGRIFEAALAAAGVCPQEALHVGDDAHCDVGGAAAAGMHTVWVNPAGHTWNQPHPPGATIGHIAELETLLQG